MANREISQQHSACRRVVPLQSGKIRQIFPRKVLSKSNFFIDLMNEASPRTFYESRPYVADVPPNHWSYSERIPPRYFRLVKASGITTCADAGVGSALVQAHILFETCSHFLHKQSLSASHRNFISLSWPLDQFIKRTVETPKQRQRPRIIKLIPCNMTAALAYSRVIATGKSL